MRRTEMLQEIRRMRFEEVYFGWSERRLTQGGKAVYMSKDGRTSKSFPALEWLAAMCSHIPNRGEQMVWYYGFRNTVRQFSSTGNPHFNSKSKTLDL
jgi:hypothetical protein